MLALFALAMQFGLSFGHTHLDRSFANVIAVSAQSSFSLPDTGRDTDNRSDVCAICVTITLANALIDSAPPVLQLPVSTVSADLTHVALVTLSGATAVGFQSRAPPRS